MPTPQTFKDFLTATTAAVSVSPGNLLYVLQGGVSKQATAAQIAVGGAAGADITPKSVLAGTTSGGSIKIRGLSSAYDSGFQTDGSGTLNLVGVYEGGTSAIGIGRMSIDCNGVHLAASVGVTWTANGYTYADIPDTGVYRVDPRTIAIGNGTAGDASGTVRAATVRAGESILNTQVLFLGYAGYLVGMGNGEWHLSDQGAVNDGNLTLGKLTASGPIKPGSCTVATVPLATASAGGQITVTDAAAGYGLYQSNGAVWRRVSDDSILS